MVCVWGHEEPLSLQVQILFTQGTQFCTNEAADPGRAGITRPGISSYPGLLPRVCPAEEWFRLTDVHTHLQYVCRAKRALAAEV